MKALLTCTMFDGSTDTEEIAWPADRYYAEATVVDYVEKAVITDEAGKVLETFEAAQYDPYANADEWNDTRCDRW